ncbi:hypothetical protein Hanom_Chr02g00147601 [Helianthus anomalus]
MENKMLGFCAIAVVLGIISAATGFAGEATRVKVTFFTFIMDTCVLIYYEVGLFVFNNTCIVGIYICMQASEVIVDYINDACVYPSSPALALGIVSAVFTIITRIYISISFGGAGCCRTDPNSTPISKLLFVLSW